MQKGMGIFLAILATVSVIVILGALLWLMSNRDQGEITKKISEQTGARPKGDLIVFSYYHGGGMDGRRYSLRIYEEDGQVKIKETRRMGVRFTEIEYDYLCPEDSLKRLQMFMEEQKLWRAKEIPNGPMKIMDAASTSWRFQTDKDFYTLYSGDNFPEKYADRFARLIDLQNEIFQQSQLVTDLSQPVIAREDFCGLEIRQKKEDQWLDLEVTHSAANDQIMIFLNHQDYPASPELVEEIYQRLASQQEMLTIYPIGEKSGNEGDYIELNLRIISRNEYSNRRSYELVKKIDLHDHLSAGQTELVEELIEYIQQQIR